MSESVNHPSHYGGDVPHEVYKCLRAWDLESDALIWNAVKYLSRAGKKTDKLGENNKIQDLQKAVWYINNRIEQLKAEENGQNENR